MHGHHDRDGTVKSSNHSPLFACPDRGRCQPFQWPGLPRSERTRGDPNISTAVRISRIWAKTTAALVSAGLGLAGASPGAVCLGAGGGSTVGGVGRAVGGAVASTGHDSLHVCSVRNLGTAHAPERGAGLVALGTTLLVCRQVEGDEENEVGAENEETGESGKLLTSAGAVVGHPGEVGRGEVCV